MERSQSADMEDLRIKVLSLETELSKALKTCNLYKEQLNGYDPSLLFFDQLPILNLLAGLCIENFEIVKSASNSSFEASLCRKFLPLQASRRKRSWRFKCIQEFCNRRILARRRTGGSAGDRVEGDARALPTNEPSVRGSGGAERRPCDEAQIFKEGEKLVLVKKSAETFFLQGRKG